MKIWLFINSALKLIIFHGFVCFVSSHSDFMEYLTYFSSACFIYFSLIYCISESCFDNNETMDLYHGSTHRSLESTWQPLLVPAFIKVVSLGCEFPPSSVFPRFIDQAAAVCAWQRLTGHDLKIYPVSYRLWRLEDERIPIGYNLCLTSDWLTLHFVLPFFLYSFLGEWSKRTWKWSPCWNRHCCHFDRAHRHWPLLLLL